MPSSDSEKKPVLMHSGEGGKIIIRFFKDLKNQKKERKEFFKVLTLGLDQLKIIL